MRWPLRPDLTAALDLLADRYGARLVRVESGGQLIGALLRSKLVDELSLLVHPCTAGTHRWFGPDPVVALPFTPIAVQQLDDGLVWLRYGARRE